MFCVTANLKIQNLVSKYKSAWDRLFLQNSLILTVELSSIRAIVLAQSLLLFSILSPTLFRIIQFPNIQSISSSNKCWRTLYIVTLRSMFCSVSIRSRYTKDAVVIREFYHYLPFFFNLFHSIQSNSGSKWLFAYLFFDAIDILINPYHLFYT